jgi:hypothetical protein
VEDECVDVITAKPAPTFCSSDEENEVWDPIDKRSDGPLWYLPTAPDIESTEDSLYIGGSSHETQPTENKSSGQHKKKKAKTLDIDVKPPINNGCRHSVLAYNQNYPYFRLFRCYCCIIVV